MVVIIGAGVSGLTLAAFLQNSGVSCVVLERRDREYIQTRQRAGVVEARGVHMFERWGLADRLLAGPVAMTIDYRLNGMSRVFKTTGSEGRFCTQQMLVNNLLKEPLDIRFGVRDVEIRNEEGERPQVRFRSEGEGTQVGYGTQTINCDYIIGCDGDRGVSRASIPEGVLTKYSHEFGYAWLAVHVEAPVKGDPIMGISDHGCVCQLPRGPQKSRYYLQCALTDGPADWSDERLWNEIRLRLCDETIENAPVLDKVFVPLRSVVYAPMQYRHLFLVGDAAHLVPPASAKGMNLALFDVDILAQALVAEDLTALQNYSATCLPHIWQYQEFAVWMTDMMHDAGDPSQHGTFYQMIARARLDNLFSSPTAALLHSEYQRGMV